MVIFIADINYIASNSTFQLPSLRPAALNMGVPEESAKQTQSERPELYNGLTRVQHMVEKGVSAVPEAFIQPAHMRSSARSLNCDLQIPVIDMALLQQGGEGKMQVQADITHACEEWGFFRVTIISLALIFLFQSSLTCEIKTNI